MDFIKKILIELSYMYQIEAHDDIWCHKEILYVDIINIRKIKVLHCHVD